MASLNGAVIGNATILRRIGIHNSNPVWELRCRCGSIFERRGQPAAMRVGNPTCGCARLRNKVTCRICRREFSVRRFASHEHLLPRKRKGRAPRGLVTRDKQRLASITHGLTKTPEYRTWCSMKSRCKYPAHVSWKDYGGRGIQVCERWLHSFENFLADMGKRPPGTSIDRWPNNDGNYQPGNCRWATSLQQNRNRRRKVVAPS